MKMLLIIFSLHNFSLLQSSLLLILRFVLWPYQQTTAYKLNALSQEWRQLCVKNMNIQSACTVLETRIDSLKREAAERWWKFCYYLSASLKGYIVSTKLKTLVVGFQGMKLRRENRECLTTSIAVRQPPSNPSTMSPLKFWMFCF